MIASTTEPRAVVSWAGASESIMLTRYDPDGQVAAVRLSPTRALRLAQELIEPAVTAIKHNQWGPGWPG